ncbi:hypothetical protein [Sphaerotilus uruguayifluvii]|uniref:Uncharacterized protein n=1 Tax=Sphaerotilus uruguayifluvii TaxID=2735897 RepID=A0ABX2G0B1_9BURK|nr:hypothetical protein [Leptothrix sp. C29]NRT55191.1 hypothetical protein [Leptothrix sp. C29]
MDHDDETGPTLADCRAWCVSFLEGVADFLQSHDCVNRREFKYRANPGELYRVTFDHRGVIRVTEWATGRHVVTSLPGRPTEPNMGIAPAALGITARVIPFPGGNA